MADKTRTVKATCLCGAAKHEITLPASELPLKAGFCHCWSCRHMTGSLCLTAASLPASYEPATEVLDQLRPYAFSPRIEQYHCKTCGSQMLSRVKHAWNDASEEPNWFVMCGTLEQADGVFEVEVHHYLADTLDGGFADFLPSVNGKPVPRYAGRKGVGEQLQMYWRSSDRLQIEPNASDRLPCRCKCGGVQFWIARPSERSKHAARPGAWWLRANGTKFLAGNCCCNSCRLNVGMEYINWAFVPTVDISLDVEGKSPFSPPFGTLEAYSSSPHVTRYHCGTCGATVFFTSDEREGLVDVAAGLIDASEGARAESWLEWYTERLSYREDAIGRAEALTLGVENGLKEFAKHLQK